MALLHKVFVILFRIGLFKLNDSKSSNLEKQNKIYLFI
jgi:hypothetical protein